MNIPENVAVAFRFAQGLWPHDVAPGSEAVGIAWSTALSGYPVDELCACLERMARSHNKMPPLAAVLAELKDARRHADLASRPVLAEAQPSRAVQDAESVKRDVWQSHLNDVERIIAERVAYETHRGRVPLAAGRLAEIREECERIGGFEAAFLATHGIEVAITVQGAGPLAETIAELAREYAERWRAASGDEVEKERLRSEASSFTDEMKAAVRECLTEMRVASA